mgnify:CR=1 FL=1
MTVALDCLSKVEAGLAAGDGLSAAARLGMAAERFHPDALNPRDTVPDFVDIFLCRLVGNRRGRSDILSHSWV